MEEKTGNIFDPDVIEKFKKLAAAADNEKRDFIRGLREMQIPPTERQLNRTPIQGEHSGEAVGRVGRNDPCPCGSGKKFKKCCLNPSA